MLDSCLADFAPDDPRRFIVVSVAVKAWISIGLILLAGYTAYTLVRITKDRRARPIASNAVTPAETKSAKPLELDSFEMTAQDGEPFGFEKLRGQVWIASLFFSSCPHECKSLNQTLAALQRDPEFDEVQFVSMSVDPAVDDPQTLSEYAKLFDADQNQRWVASDAKSMYPPATRPIPAVWCCLTVQESRADIFATTMRRISPHLRCWSPSYLPNLLQEENGKKQSPQRPGYLGHPQGKSAVTQDKRLCMDTRTFFHP